MSLSKKELKIFKGSYKLKRLIKVFNESSFILCYYYEYLSLKDLINLRQILKEKNLSYYIVEKKMLNLYFKNTNEFDVLKEFLHGSVVLVYSNEKSLIDFSFIKINESINKALSKIILFGIKVETQFYKPNKILTIPNFEEINKNLVLLNIMTVLKNFHNIIFKLR